MYKVHFDFQGLKVIFGDSFGVVFQNNNNNNIIIIITIIILLLPGINISNTFIPLQTPESIKGYMYHSHNSQMGQGNKLPNYKGLSVKMDI